MLDGFARRRPPQGVDPALVFAADLSNPIREDEWKRAGLSVLSDKSPRTLVLFSSDAHLQEFSRLLRDYGRGPKRGNKHAANTALFSNIERLRPLEPEDRIGRMLQSVGLDRPGALVDSETYVLDVELWHTGDRLDCLGRIRGIKTFVEASGGKVPDSYVGESVVALRVRAPGTIIKSLLSFDAVASIDYPARASTRRARMIERGIDNLRLGPQPRTGAPGVCVIDSGVTSGHPLLGPWIGEATAIPEELGDPTDESGHGTAVAGIALFGDVEACLEASEFASPLQIFSARVLNGENAFDEESLVLSQMTNAITYFRDTYGCRVFNLSIGDDRLTYGGGKVTGWTAVLDDLARRLDVVIVVSAGNYGPGFYPGTGDSERLNDYPRHLLKPEARIIEPATASIVLTVGALARSHDVPDGELGPLSFRPVALSGEPSPFSRAGPGIMDAIKPDLCAFGGNCTVDQTGSAITNPEGEIVTLNADYVSRPFSSDVGTSLAAPAVAHLAARILQKFPNAQANLVRALLASSAEVPEAALNRLDGLDEDGPLKFCGYGMPDVKRALTSDSNRAVLYASDEIPINAFHLFPVPVPAEFYGVAGQRRIAVTLAFDPPVRHTRIDYLGHEMGFRLIRGKTLQEVVRAFRAASPSASQGERIGPPYNCTTTPGPRRREGGTLQKGVFTVRQRAGQYGDTYFVVVTSRGKWLDEEDPPQRYSLVVSIDHQAEVDLYTQIRARIRERARVRA
jgi:hypothetical protein